MIKIRLRGTSEEIKKFTDRGKSVYKRVYMDVELIQPPVDSPCVHTTIPEAQQYFGSVPIHLHPFNKEEIITLNDSGNCPYKGICNGKEVCILSSEPTNSAVQCDFEFENCELYQQREKFRKEILENQQALDKFFLEGLKRQTKERK